MNEIWRLYSKDYKSKLGLGEGKVMFFRLGVRAVLLERANNELCHF
jgi:hypothetical protein